MNVIKPSCLTDAEDKSVAPSEKSMADAFFDPLFYCDVGSYCHTLYFCEVLSSNTDCFVWEKFIWHVMLLLAIFAFFSWL